MKNSVLCLLGPTACGKSALALKLAKEFPCEIINVDAAQIYRGCDIGTAKPTQEERTLVPHHLLDICEVTESYSAARFVADATSAINDILVRGKVPLLVGGTMLYFKALEEGLTTLPKKDPKIREQIFEEAKNYGWEYLHTELTKIDPESAAKIHPHDSQRIERAHEVYRLTGEPMSKLHLNHAPLLSPYTFYNLVLWPKNRDQLKTRISQRFFAMLQAGFVQEVDNFYHTQKYNCETPAFRMVGYREIWQYLSGKMSFQQLCELVPLATWHLAKRQLTWLKKWPQGAQVISADDGYFAQTLNLIKNLLNSQ